MKYLFFLPILFFSCSNIDYETQTASDIDSNKYLDESCVKKVNEIYSQITTEDNYQFDSVTIVSPNFIPNFYNKKDLIDFSFLKLTNKEYESLIAIADFADDLNYHKMYFCGWHNDQVYIDESSYIGCNFSFINECGLNISQRTFSDSINFYQNIYDNRMVSLWTVDSSSIINNFSKILINNKTITLDATTEYSYILENNRFVFSEKNNNFTLDRLAFSSEKLILIETLDDESKNYYYLTKSHMDFPRIIPLSMKE